MFIDTSLHIRDRAAPAALAGFEPIACLDGGSEIYGPGDRACGYHVVAFGAVRVYRLLADGRRQITGFYLPGEEFGFETGDTHQFFADAIGATGIRSIRPAETDRKVLALALRGLSFALDRQLLLGRQSAGEKVAVFLLDMAGRQGDLDEIRLPMSRLDIADYLGLTIETVSRTLSKFKADGLIDLPGLREVRVLRRERLKRMAG